MHAKRGSRALLVGWVCIAVGCSSKVPEEPPAASRTEPLAVVGWEATGAMAEARKLHAGVVLPSGQVLVTGGSRGATYLASATVYEPVTGTWKVVAPMPQARQAHTLTVLNTGKVLVAGGEASGFLASTAVYDPASNTWASAGNFATGVARGYMTATELADGRVMVAGGLSNGPHGRVDVYDPVAGTWAVGPTMRTGRRSHTATRLANGKVLVVGGWSGGATGTAEVYDPATNTWSVTGALTTARYDHTATLLPSGQVLVAGGRNGTQAVASAELYEPATGAWSVTGAMGTARELHTATLLSTGKVLVAGGRNGSSSGLGSAEVYEEASGQWSAVQTMVSARNQHVAVALEALGKVLVVGGSGLATAELYVYDACAGVSCNSAPGPCYEAAGTCSQGVCSYAPKASGASCNDGDACTGTDVCNGAGVCAGTATSCNSAPGQCYEAAGTCSGGACDYEYKAAGVSCDDADACTLSEVCNGAGGCAGTPVSCTTPPGQCYEAAGTCSGGACSYAPKAAGSTCNDGNAGTLNDVCNGSGVCAGVAACTTPPSACHDLPGTYVNGACTYPLKAAGSTCAAGQICTPAGQCASKCWIGGALYDSGTQRPGVVCEECNPGLSTSSWSAKSNGTSCGTSQGAWGSCGGFDDFCDTTGTQTRTVTASTCGAGTCSATSTSTETQACTRAAPNTSCAAPSYGQWSACTFSDACVLTGTQSRTVTSSTYSCATGQCVATTSTETQSCSRATTNGNSCGAPQYGNWSSCGGYSDACDETGTQSRSETTYACLNGACNPSTSTKTQACSVNKNGDSCGSVPECDSCGGFNGACDESGTQTCTTRSYTCSNGQCNPSGTSGSWTQSCTVNRNGESCGGGDDCDSCSGFSGACDESGTQTCTTTSYTCSSGQCNLTSSSSRTQACSVSREGAVCNGASTCSGCGGFSSTCDESGTQSCTTTVYTCSSGQCSNGTVTNSWSQACSESKYGIACGASPASCTACSGFSNTCDETGTQTCSTTAYICAGGSCGTPAGTSSWSQACSIDTDGQSCGPLSGHCGPCEGFTSDCDQTGTQTCTTNSYACSGGQCSSSGSTTTQACTRSVGPDSCGTPPGECYEPSGSCVNDACSYAPKPSGSYCEEVQYPGTYRRCNGSGTCVDQPCSCLKSESDPTSLRPQCDGCGGW